MNVKDSRVISTVMELSSLSSYAVGLVTVMHEPELPELSLNVLLDNVKSPSGNPR